MKTIDKPIIVEHFYNVSKEKLWEALTNPKKMREWYFDNIEDFNAEEGFTTQFDVKSDSRIFLHKWTVTKVIPLKKITYDWEFDGLKGKSSTCFELSGTQSQAILKLTATVIEDFPRDIPEFKRESGVKGWDYFIKQQLDAYLNG